MVAMVQTTNTVGLTLLHNCNFHCPHCAYLWVGDTEDHVIIAAVLGSRISGTHQWAPHQVKGNRQKHTHVGQKAENAASHPKAPPDASRMDRVRELMPDIAQPPWYSASSSAIGLSRSPRQTYMTMTAQTAPSRPWIMPP